MRANVSVTVMRQKRTSWPSIARTKNLAKNIVNSRDTLTTWKQPDFHVRHVIE